MANGQQTNLPSGDTALAVAQFSVSVDVGGLSQKVTLSAASAQSAALTSPYVVLSLDVPAWVRRGANPTAVADGTDMYLPAGIYRLAVVTGQKLAIIAAGAGNAYITPGA